MIQAGGVIFLSLKTKRICLFLRSTEVSNPHTWGFIGGKINPNESVISGISREIQEEMGFIPKVVKSIPVDVYKSNDANFRYYSLIVTVEEEFIPELNYENSGYGWFGVDALPRPLHVGAKSVLLHNDFKRILDEIVTDSFSSVNG